MLILILGPYRSGTGGDPDKMAANLRRLEAAVWPLFQAGHVPMIGEWVALPVWRTADGRTLGDNLCDRIFYPAAERLLQVCDAVLRLSGSWRIVASTSVPERCVIPWSARCLITPANSFSVS